MFRDSLFLGNAIESSREEFFRGIFCKHDYINYGIVNRCWKCGKIKHK